MAFPKLRLPVRFYLAGSSQTGKSSLVKGMIENAASIFERPFTRILIARKAHDDLHTDLVRAFPDLVVLIDGMPTEFLANIQYEVRPGDNVLLWFDDLIQQVSESADAEGAFYISSSKFGVSIVLTSQNFYHRSSKLKNITQNCNLLGLTENRRDGTQIATLARQLYPDDPAFIVDAYRKTMSLRPFNYLLVSVHPLTDARLRVFTGVLPGEDLIFWQPKKTSASSLPAQPRKNPRRDTDAI